ncbi:MAG: PHP domain-containing protein [Treponemataceae bacterium]|nr:PHP domain-containing protein [Treponemataceae bacterium]
MKYIYETHLHTNVGSKCGVTAPEDYIKPYLDRGFTGIIVTDHFFNGNCAVDRSLPWKEQVDAFVSGYERAYEAGLKGGLDVFFGFETRLGNDEYLIYGLDKAWLYVHPEIVTATRAEQYRLVRDGGGAVVQAHPYRERSYQDGIDLYPWCVDAIERHNFGNSKFEDDRCDDYIKRYDFCCTAGSDMHDVTQLEKIKPFGVISEKKWTGIDDYVQILKSHTQLELYVESIPFQRVKESPGFEVVEHRDERP